MGAAYPLLQLQPDFALPRARSHDDGFISAARSLQRPLSRRGRRGTRALCLRPLCLRPLCTLCLRTSRRPIPEALASQEGPARQDFRA